MNTFQKLIGISLLIISISVAYYFAIFLPQFENKKLEIMKIENYNANNVIQPTITSMPTIAPSPIPSTKVVQNYTDCKTIESNLNSTYNNIYTIDDILIAQNIECHYELQRRNHLTVNDQNIRTQMNPNQQIQLNNSINCMSNKIGNYTYTNCN